MISLALFCSYHIYYYFLDIGTNELVEVYYEEKKEDVVNNKDNNRLVAKLSNETKDEYLGILKIPKINLRQGFYSINSKNNNINKAVTILKESTFPSTNGSIIYLIAHSGNGYYAFFKDLDKLSINDIITLDINNNTYQYVVNDIYNMPKTGKIMVNHNIHENYLVLSTCLGKDKQLIVTSKLLNYN
jgi:LPXTG-site transpeptidase (sortase) family protein